MEKEINTGIFPDVGEMTIDEIDCALNNLPMAVSCCIITGTEARERRYLLMRTKEKKILETL